MIRIFMLCSAAIVLAVSCAEQPEEDTQARQQLAFDAWITNHVEGAVKLPSGVYIKKLTTVDDGVVRTPVEGNWVSLDYTGRVLTTDNVFVTRDSAMARQQGTFQYYTHYAPQFARFKLADSSGVIEGLYDALAVMNEGERALIYIPGTLTYSTNTTFNGGYQGQTASVTARTPLVFDLTLKKIVSDPLSSEISDVQEFAYRNWGKMVSDTIHKNMYRKRLSIGKDTATVYADSSVCVYYVGRLMDGFIFDTNIKDTAIKYNIYKSNSAAIKYDSLKVSLTTTDTTYVKGFYDAIIGMKYGEIAETIFPSTYGYGTTLQSGSTTTWIEPYSPLRYTIEVVPRNGDGTARHPYTIKGVKTLDKPEQNVWVIGYLVGAVEGDKVSTDAVYSDTINVTTNILLADTRTANSADKVIAVKLPAGPIRDAVNLKDNASRYYRKRVAFKGNLRLYLGQIGLVDVTEYVKP